MREKMQEALYYENLTPDTVQCRLCPHSCVIKNGKLGRCRVRAAQNGKLYTLNDGRVTAYAYDPIEKKPLYHFHPNKMIFSIGSFGCNFDCDFCQNWEIVQGESYGMGISDEDLVEAAGSKGSIGIAYTYSEPTVFYEYMLRLAQKIKEKELLNVMVTNGYINREPLEELLPFMDAMNIDLKSFSEETYRDLCAGSLNPVLETIETAAKKIHVEVTTLVIGGVNDSTMEIEALAKRMSEISRDIPLHLSRYFPANRMLLPPTPVERLIHAKQVALKHLKYVHIGNVPGLKDV